MMLFSISGVSGTLALVSVTADGVDGAGGSSAGLLCGHTAAHKAKQAANAAAMMIRFFVRCTSWQQHTLPQKVDKSC